MMLIEIIRKFFLQYFMNNGYTRQNCSSTPTDHNVEVACSKEWNTIPTFGVKVTKKNRLKKEEGVNLGNTEITLRKILIEMTKKQAGKILKVLLTQNFFISMVLYLSFSQLREEVETTIRIKVFNFFGKQIFLQSREDSQPIKPLSTST